MNKTRWAMLLAGLLLLVFIFAWTLRVCAPQRTEAVGVPPRAAETEPSQESRSAARLLANARMSKKISPSLPKQAPATDPDIFEAIFGAYPSAGWSPGTESIQAFCERLPGASHIVYGSDSFVSVAFLQRTYDADGNISCVSEGVVTVEEEGPGCYAISSERKTRIDAGEDGSYEIPFLTIRAKRPEMHAALAEMENWLELLKMAQSDAGTGMSPAASRRVVRGIRFETMEYLLDERAWRFVQLSPEVWRNLSDERFSLGDAMFSDE